MIRYLRGLVPTMHDYPHYDRHGNCRCRSFCCTRVGRHSILRGDEIVRVPTIKRVCQGRHVIGPCADPDRKPMRWGRFTVAIGICLTGFFLGYTTDGPFNIPDNTRPPTPILSREDIDHTTPDPWNGR
ncbi:MAG TPA: hypothetical protein VJ553_00565 [Candidatus Paceibacterota bacterium]|nr:hypothetical protein [Candidatus Paceibacterota bacterium]